MSLARVLSSLLLVVAFAMPATSQNLTDLEPVEIIVDQPGDLPPVVDSPVRVRVRVTNHGPDPYDGTTQAKAGGHPLVQGGRLRITIDIDEPTKPEPDGFPTLAASAVLHDSFAVNIAVNDTVTLDFGLTNYIPHRTGLHEDAGLVTPGVGNFDTNPTNDLKHDFFIVLPVMPATGVVTLSLLVLLLVGGAAWSIRRRARSAPSAPR